MPDTRYKLCKRCHRSTAEVGPLSWTRQCLGCAHERLEENIVGIATHTGPAFHRWRRASVAAFGGVLLDDLPSDAQTPA